MGEIADMMLNGDMCECCGVWLDGEGEGFPRYCSNACAKNRGAPFMCDVPRIPKRARRPKPFKCLDCSRRFRSDAAMRQHRKDTHDKSEAT